MYALINTMSHTQDSIGTVLSLHRTIEAAERADERIQRLTRRGSENSYLPTRIVRCVRRPAGRWIGRHEWEAIR